MLAIRDRIVTMREGRVTGAIAAGGGERGAPDADDDAGAGGMNRARALSSGAGGRSFDALQVLGRFAPLIFLLVLMLVFAVLEPRFLQPLNLFNVMRQISITGLIAIGMTFVILTAGIDLSVGSLLALAGLVAAAVAKGGLANRFTVGAVQEAQRLRLVPRACSRRWSWAWPGGLHPGHGDHPPQGAALRRHARRALGLSRRRAAVRRRRPDQRLRRGLSLVGPGQDRRRVPVPVIVFLLFAVLAHVVLRYTRYGRQVYAVGGNPEAARLSGLDVRRITLSVYVIIGFFAGLARLRAVGPAQLRRGGRRDRLRADRDRLGGDRRHQPVRRRRQRLRHGHRLGPDRRPDQRPGADERLAPTSSRSSSA